MCTRAAHLLPTCTLDGHWFAWNVHGIFQNHAISLDNSSVTINLKLESSNEIIGFWNLSCTFHANQCLSGVHAQRTCYMHIHEQRTCYMYTRRQGILSERASLISKSWNLVGQFQFKVNGYTRIVQWDCRILKSRSPLGNNLMCEIMPDYGKLCLILPNCATLCLTMLYCAKYMPIRTFGKNLALFGTVRHSMA